ncbi:MAG: competence/damage-inducible protein A, partial [Salibacteraceae bacterium]|nr:competence/damage-inducible protein A [Salibacteraceae bacterium]
MKARIVTIGDEILIGQIIDTNSAWLAAQLNALGVRVHSIYSISDTQEAIHKALDESLDQVDLVLMTGGLGPTKDDITKAALADWFESDWKIDEVVLARVKHHFASRGIPMPAVNLDQAKVPSVCEILANENGSAPGMWFKKGNTVFISMPGVPYEMKAIFADYAVPKIVERMSLSKIVHKTIMTQGI